MSKQTGIIVGQKTDVGQIRDHNEDSLGLFEPVDFTQLVTKGSLYIVADGMGGHEAGETASDLAVKTVISEYFQDPETDPAVSLKKSVQTANQRIFEHSVDHSLQANMGTTVISAVIVDDRLYIGNVGDSRAYLIRDGHIVQLSEDHSWVAEQVKKGLLREEQAEQHPQRNILTRSVGVEQQTEIDIHREELQKGDVIVLCSDGLHGIVKAAEIKTEVINNDPQAAAENLVRLANERGAPDNITIIILKISSLSGNGGTGLSGKKNILVFIAVSFILFVLGFALARLLGLL